MNPILLTDQNVQLVADQLRKLLQRQALQLEADLAIAPGERLEIPFTLTLKKKGFEGRAYLEFQYVPLVRRDHAEIKLEDVRQLGLLP